MFPIIHHERAMRHFLYIAWCIGCNQLCKVGAIGAVFEFPVDEANEFGFFEGRGVCLLLLLAGGTVAAGAVAFPLRQGIRNDFVAAFGQGAEILGDGVVVGGKFIVEGRRGDVTGVEGGAHR